MNHLIHLATFSKSVRLRILTSVDIFRMAPWPLAPILKVSNHKPGAFVKTKASASRFCSKAGQRKTANRCCVPITRSTQNWHSFKRSSLSWSNTLRDFVIDPLRLKISLLPESFAGCRAANMSELGASAAFEFTHSCRGDLGWQKFRRSLDNHHIGHYANQRKIMLALVDSGKESRRVCAELFMRKPKPHYSKFSANFKAWINLSLRVRTRTLKNH